MDLILLLDKLMFLNMAGEKLRLLIAILSAFDGDNVRDVWFLKWVIVLLEIVWDPIVEWMRLLHMFSVLS